MDKIQAWCECWHHASWHPDGGPCTYWADEMQDSEVVPVVCQNDCKELRLAHVEVTA